jgi:phosphoglycerol geranylgeranyltransferase
MKKKKSVIYEKFTDGTKKFAILIDPDNATVDSAKKMAISAEKNRADLILYGGSLLTRNNYEHILTVLKDNCSVPVVLFPGNYLQISSLADGILLLSLISGRNPELLIGKHIVAAPLLHTSGLEIIPTGYMLIESGRQTTVTYMSNTTPIPSDKPPVAVCTALAGEMLGLKLIYMDAGSGAASPVPEAMIKAVRENITCPLVIGGGIRTADQALRACRSGADVVVAGNAIEQNNSLLARLCDAVHSLNL